MKLYSDLKKISSSTQRGHSSFWEDQFNITGEDATLSFSLKGKLT